MVSECVSRQTVGLQIDRSIIMKVVISAWIGSNNLGDELIYKALLAQFESIGIGRQDVTAVTMDVSGTQAK